MNMSNKMKGASKSVIRLNQLTAADSFPAYVAIHSPQVAENPFALSPNVMLWSDDILLCKVDDCEQFWLAQQQKYQCDLNQLFDQILNHHFGAEYIAVFANHPWQCLVYLDYQMNQKSQGVYFLQSLLNRNIYKSLSWQFWFAPQQTLIHHLEQIKAKQFNPASFRSKQAQLKRFINRIGLTGPFDLQQADDHAITRRFDVWAGKIWRWTFVRSSCSQSSDAQTSNTQTSDLQCFPWIPFAEPLRPTVSRDLEYPLNQWSHIQVLLCEDFEKLCMQFEGNENEHINRMLWKITLFNEQVIDVELSFRHPYSLHRELPEFKTAMYQAWYVYDDLMRQLRRRDKDLDLPETMPLASWSVEVCERIQLPPVLWDLFAHDNLEDDSSDAKFQNIRELQNKLPTLIEAYHCEANFCPECSFETSPIGNTPDTAFDHLQWSASSNQRPLFYHPESQQIDIPSIKPHQFLERCASRWWLLDDSINQSKDYYVLKDNKGHASWVYRDGKGQWFKQGEYT